MKNNIDEGGQAFPLPEGSVKGMTFRDYVAVEAMKSLLNEHGSGSLTVSKMQYAYEIADLMIKARQL